MTAFVLGLSVAAGAMAWHFGFTRGVRIGRALEREDAKAKREARMHQLFEDIRVEKLNDRAAIDALVGPSTYEGGE
jgi:hypothetical protein